MNRAGVTLSTSDQVEALQDSPVLSHANPEIVKNNIQINILLSHDIDGTV